MPWGARYTSCWPFCAIRSCSARQGSCRRQRARWTICFSRASAKVSWQRRRLVRCCTPVPRIAANRWCANFRIFKHCRKKWRPITFTINTQAKKEGGRTLIKILWQHKEGKHSSNYIHHSNNPNPRMNLLESQKHVQVTLRHPQSNIRIDLM
jgi:hypothetical protein